LPGGVVMNVGYNGAKGTRLDTQRALVVSGGQPFTYESSEGNSILHAATVRVRKRIGKGSRAERAVRVSKSIDDASSIVAGEAWWRKTRLISRWIAGFPASINGTNSRETGFANLPFGDNRRFVTKGSWSHILGGWQWSGDFRLDPDCTHAARAAEGWISGVV